MGSVNLSILSLKLKGGTKRGDNPRLRSVFTPRKDDANTEGLVLRYAAKNCPAGSVYGQVRAFTPLLSEPLEGPIYLRAGRGSTSFRLVAGLVRRSFALIRTRTDPRVRQWFTRCLQGTRVSARSRAAGFG